MRRLEHRERVLGRHGALLLVRVEHGEAEARLAKPRGDQDRPPGALIVQRLAHPAGLGTAARCGPLEAAIHMRCPSPLVRSYVRPETMLRDQSARRRHPFVGREEHRLGHGDAADHVVQAEATRGPPASRRSRSSSSYSSRVPFACPNTSHACHTGSAANRANSPNPPIALYGAFSLKKNGSPGRMAEKRRAAWPPEVDFRDLGPGEQELVPAVVCRGDESVHAGNPLPSGSTTARRGSPLLGSSRSL